MRESVIVEALRTPIARGKQGKGDLCAFHPTQLLGKVQDAVVERAGVDPVQVEQVTNAARRPVGKKSRSSRPGKPRCARPSKPPGVSAPRSPYCSDSALTTSPTARPEPG